MYNPQYDPSFVIEDLKNHGVDLIDFENRLKKIARGTVFNQPLFEILYNTYKINNYKI